MIRKGGGTRVCVGMDGRLSSPELAEAVIGGLCAGGIDVQWIGRGPTPMLYFAVHHLDADGGVQVTGSHNPPAHNGFKMMLGKRSFFGDADPGARVGSRRRAGMPQGNGRRTEAPVFDAYVERLAPGLSGGRALSVVWDAGNGAAGEALSALTARLPGRHELLFAEIDGRFPNHHPDPTVDENLEDLKAAVAAEGAEIGIAFDGDGDRIGVVDGQRPDRARRPADADPGRRGAAAASRARRSSPTSRRARRCSTRSSAWAASRSCGRPAIR